MRHLFLLAGALALLAVACGLAAPRRAPAVPGREAEFPHAVHLTPDTGLGCTDCHGGAESEERAGMPGLGTCALCHFPEEEEAAAGALHPVVAPFAAAPGAPPLWSALTALSVPSRFSHARHAEAGLDCASCHGAVAEGSAVDAGVHVDMDACVRCHEQRSVADGGCAGCHPGVDRSTRPRNHDASWERLHGPVTRASGSTRGGRDGVEPALQCALCHDESGPTPSCAECHLTTPPQDHTPFFRNQGHGILAAFDRGRCRACHQEDACAACHAVTQPRSHGPGWGAPRNQHCLGCHIPSGRSRGCLICHADGAPAHQAAPPPPPTVPAHGTATACMVCHATVRPPRHPFTGDGNYCRSCHR
jgi:hypothetical protein